MLYKVSVIIPTYNRKKSLEMVIDSLEKQTLPQNQFEVIVVDDGSTDDTSSIINKPTTFSLKYLRNNNQGAAFARNHGANIAQGKILFFLDDDIYVTQEYLQILTEADQNFARSVFIGTLASYPREGLSTFHRIYSINTVTVLRESPCEFEEINFTECLSGMLGVDRQHFFEIGAFQDLAKDGRVAWGDVDFGFRASRLGFKFIRCNSVVGYHDDFSIQNLQTCAKRWYRTSQDAVKLFLAYPEMEILPMFRDKIPINWKQDNTSLVLKKSLRTLASTRLLVSCLEYSAKYLERKEEFHRLLVPIYRFVISGYIYKGFREGLHQNHIKGF
jgi:glycosyltransferase involved in cell wall biosynthesis